MRRAEELLQELCSVDESHHIEAKRAMQIDQMRDKPRPSQLAAQQLGGEAA